MTDEQKSKYLQNTLTTRCPYCDSRRIEYLENVAMFNGDKFHQGIHCEKCKKNWIEEYTLTNIRDVDEWNMPL